MAHPVAEDGKGWQRCLPPFSIVMLKSMLGFDLMLVLVLWVLIRDGPNIEREATKEG
jgi:hypothetical protein